MAGYISQRLLLFNCFDWIVWVLTFDDKYGRIVFMRFIITYCAPVYSTFDQPGTLDLFPSQHLLPIRICKYTILIPVYNIRNTCVHVFYEKILVSGGNI